MKLKKFCWEKTVFPFTMSICAFLCFIIINLLCAIYIIPPVYDSLLICVIPALIFLGIAIYMGQSARPKPFVTITAIILVPILAFFSFIYIIFIVSDALPIENPKIYERVMNFGENKTREIFMIFPQQIPKEAYNVVFYYNEEGFQDYKIEARLKFTANSDIINDYIFLCESKKLNTIYKAPEWVDIVGNGKAALDDFTTYWIINDYFEISIVLINQNSNEIIFYACTFTM